MKQVEEMDTCRGDLTRRQFTKPLGITGAGPWVFGAPFRPVGAKQLPISYSFNRCIGTD
jgi:hypothetical protein